MLVHAHRYTYSGYQKPLKAFQMRTSSVPLAHPQQKRLNLSPISKSLANMNGVVNGWTLDLTCLHASGSLRMERCCTQPGATKTSLWIVPLTLLSAAVLPVPAIARLGSASA